MDTSLILKFTEKFKISQNNINSFHEFMETSLRELIEQKNPLILYNDIEKHDKSRRYEINFKISRIDEYPKENGIPLFPNDCRISTFRPYTVPIYITYSYKIFDPNGKLVDERDDNEEFEFMRIPVMIGSKYCITSNKTINELENVHEDPNDIGGYFILNGNEYVIKHQEHKANNMVLLNKMEKKEGGYVAFIQSKPHRKYDFPYKTHVQYNPNDTITVIFAISGKPVESRAIPVDMIFRALGVLTEKEMFKYILGNSDKNESELYEVFKNNLTLTKPENRISFKNVVSYIIEKNFPNEKKKQEYNNFIYNWLFPHLGKNLEKKKYFLGYLVNIVLQLKLKQIPLDNRKNYGNKRLIGPNTGLLFLIRQIFNKHINELAKKNVKLHEKKSISDYIMLSFNSNEFNKKIVKAFTTGNWGLTGAGTSRTGTTIMFERKSFMDMISACNRIVQTMTEQQKQNKKNSAPRIYDTSQHGRVGCNETPNDGENIGIVKEMSMSLIITSERPFQNIEEIILDHKYADSLDKVGFNFGGKYKIFINSDWVACVNSENIIEFNKYLIEKRREKVIDSHVEITRDNIRKEIRIFTDEGRLLAPFFIVDNIDGKNILRIDKLTKDELDLMKWDDLCSNEYIEYIDIHEEMEYLIAKNREMLKLNHVYTHMALPHCFYQPYTTNVSILQNNNPGPRRTYAMQQGKQSVGLPTTQIEHSGIEGRRFENFELPLVNSYIGCLYGINQMVAGQTVWEAVYGNSYNIEDAVVMKRSFIERGGMISYEYSHIKHTFDNGEQKANPIFNKNIIKNEFRSYDAFGKDGIPIEGRKINKGDYAIGIVTEDKDGVIKDSSIRYNGDDNSTINKVYQFSKNNSILVQFIARRIPDIGDKFCYKLGTKISCKTITFGVETFHTKDIDKLNGNELVITLNPKTYKTEWSKIKKHFIFYFDSIMYKIKSNEIDITITNNHNIFVRYPGELEFKLIRIDQVYKDLNIGKIKYVEFLKGLKNIDNNIVKSYSNSQDMINYLGKNEGIYPCNIINFNTDTKLIHPNFTTKVYLNEITEIKKWNRPVCCIEAELNHIIYVAYNGKWHWNGNSSRHGQKGTISKITEEFDLPYCLNGQIPDKLMGPHGYPSRMTSGQFYESIMGRYACTQGKFIDGTIFSIPDIEKMGDVLEKNGQDRYGDEIMINPYTCNKITNKIHMGPIYYQKLSHMIATKPHVRGDSGRIDPLTSQPVKGKNGGGVKVGEMDKDILLAHGAVEILTELWKNKSDGFEMFICGKCGDIAIGNDQKKFYYCYNCNSSEDIHRISTNYASKLLIQELTGLNLRVRLFPHKNKY